MMCCRIQPWDNHIYTLSSWWVKNRNCKYSFSCQDQVLSGAKACVAVPKLANVRFCYKEFGVQLQILSESIKQFKPERQSVSLTNFFPLKVCFNRLDHLCLSFNPESQNCLWSLKCTKCSSFIFWIAFKIKSKTDFYQISLSKCKIHLTPFASVLHSQLSDTELANFRNHLLSCVHDSSAYKSLMDIVWNSIWYVFSC